MRLLIFFFFFSSRRRHTRSKRDWSSDVCSSDLYFLLLDLLAYSIVVDAKESCDVHSCTEVSQHHPDRNVDDRSRLVGTRLRRSEERRVGKECRSRWWPEH